MKRQRPSKPTHDKVATAMPAATPPEAFQSGPAPLPADTPLLGQGPSTEDIAARSQPAIAPAHANASAASAAAMLPADPADLTDADIRARYGWVTAPSQGFPVSADVIAALLGIPGPLLQRMLSSTPAIEGGEAPASPPLATTGEPGDGTNGGSPPAPAG